MADVLIKLGKGAGAIRTHKPTPGQNDWTGRKAFLKKLRKDLNCLVKSLGEKVAIS